MFTRTHTSFTDSAKQREENLQTEIEELKEELCRLRENSESKISVLDRTVRRLEQENRKLQVDVSDTPSALQGILNLRCFSLLFTANASLAPQSSLPLRNEQAALKAEESLSEALRERVQVRWFATFHSPAICIPSDSEASAPAPAHLLGLGSRAAVRAAPAADVMRPPLQVLVDELAKAEEGSLRPDRRAPA